jgi:molybdopterin molybdotransferase
MLSVNEAREFILSQFHPVDSTVLPLLESAGRILYEPVTAEIDLPAFDNSSVDGFAVRSTDLDSAGPLTPVILKVIGDVPAGIISGLSVREGESARIMTGAAVPEGADTVVMVEDTDVNIRNAAVPPPSLVTILKKVESGSNIRQRGADVVANQVILPSRHRLKAQDVGLLAMLGIPTVKIFRRPRVAILSSGDELISPETPLTSGKVRDANSYALSILATDAGAEILFLGIAKDNPDSIKKLLDRAFDANVDAIISSAGVSLGAFDFIKGVVETNGALDFWKVDMRPGKPLAFGNYRGIPFFGLPGNPVSAYIGFMVFITPALEKLSGGNSGIRKIQRVKLTEPVYSDGRESYLRAVVTSENNEHFARLTGHQASSNMLSLVHANALLIIPSGVKSVPPGEEIDAWLL